MFAKDGIFLEKNEPQQQKPIEKKGTENLTETLIFQKPVQQEMPDFSKITTISSLVTFEKSVARSYTRRQSRLKSKMMSDRLDKQLDLCLAEEKYEQPPNVLVLLIPRDETSVTEMNLPAHLELENIAQDVQHRFCIDESLLNLLPALNTFSGKTEIAQVDKVANKEEIPSLPDKEVENPSHKQEIQTITSDDSAKKMQKKKHLQTHLQNLSKKRKIRCRKNQIFQIQVQQQKKFQIL